MPNRKVANIVPMQGFRELRVWQAGIDLVELVYRLTTSFPKEEIYGLTNQMRRAAVSIPSNIAEGHTRESIREYLQYIAIAQSSLAELETQVEIAKRLHYIQPDQIQHILDNVAALGKQLYALRNALAKKT
jgi:four helix bundle protein